MNKDKLISMGLSEEQATAVMGELDGNFVTKARFNEVNAELKQAQSSIKERDKQLEEVKKDVGENEELKKRIQNLQETNKATMAESEKQAKRFKAESAITNALISAKAKDVDVVRKLISLDMETVDFNDDGTVKGLNDIIQGLTGNEVTASLFGETVPVKGAKPVESSTGGGLPPAKDPKQMTYAELCEYLATQK